MLRTDSQSSEGRKNICFVLGDERLTKRSWHRLHAAQKLAALGCRVWIFTPLRSSSFDFQQLKKALKEDGIDLRSLDSVKIPDSLRLATPNNPAVLQDSDCVRWALESLHQHVVLDMVEFSDTCMLGFRTIQAKQSGCIFDDLNITCFLQSTSHSRLDEQQRFPNNTDELYVSHMSKYSFENADVQILSAPTREQITVQRWRMRDDVQVLSEEEYASDTISPGLLQMHVRRRRDSLETTPKDGSGIAPLVTVCIPFYNKGHLLEATLESLVAQTYKRIEVIVIDDGSTDDASRRVFDRLQKDYPTYRFERQTNAGIGATRNRGLQEARGRYFIPVDADNIAHPEMVERFAQGMLLRPGLAALTSYFLAFESDQDLVDGKFAYAYRPTGGPRLLACLHNIYGDANAIFDTLALSSVGGFETDRDSSWEDWEVFVKLANAGFEIDVIPEVLFYYRHLSDGFSRKTGAFRNRLRVLRQFFKVDRLSPGESQALWATLVGFHLQLEKLSDENRSLKTRLRSTRYRIVDSLSSISDRVPFLKNLVKNVFSL